MSKPTTAARPKRAGEDFARTHDPNGSNKKPRFDYRNPSTLAPDARDEEEDLILNADVIGKSGAQPKRNAVNIDGYESDSDNDNFNERARERERRGQKEAEGGKSKDEDEDDMFADLEEDIQGTASGDEDEEKAGKRKKKDVKFLDPSEIEGQVMNSTSGGRVPENILLDGKGNGKEKAEEDSESSGDEEERDRLDEEMEDDLAAEIGAGGKKKHAPRLDAFNLKAEEEEGKYDESGNYVRKATDPDAVNDNWMDGVTRKDMKRAREAQEKREDERRRKAIEDDAVLTSDLLSTLIGALETGETALEALQRLNKNKPRETKVPKWKQKKQKEKMDVDEAVTMNGNGASHDPVEEARKKTVDAITGAADGLYARGQIEIYDKEREVLMRQYKRETGEEWQHSAPADPNEGAPDTWEYRWSDARDGGDSHGPYDAATMKAWNEAGYFGEGVEFRRAGDAEWSRLLDLD